MRIPAAAWLCILAFSHRYSITQPYIQPYVNSIFFSSTLELQVFDFNDLVHSIKTSFFSKYAIQ